LIAAEKQEETCHRNINEEQYTLRALGFALRNSLLCHFRAHVYGKPAYGQALHSGREPPPISVKPTGSNPPTLQARVLDGEACVKLPEHSLEPNPGWRRSFDTCACLSKLPMALAIHQPNVAGLGSGQRGTVVTSGSSLYSGLFRLGQLDSNYADRMFMTYGCEIPEAPAGLQFRFRTGTNDCIKWISCVDN
jgi:hypothetical protein